MPGCPNCTSRDGTDILLTHDSPPLLRVDGTLVPLEGAEPLTGDEIEVIARTQIKDQYGDRLHMGREVDFSFSWRDQARIRANAFYQRGNCSLSLRRIPMQIPTPIELGLPPASWPGILRNPSGLILVTGPTGSGKSTTHGLDDRRHQPEPALPHRHHRGPHRVPARQPAGRGQPARGRHRHRVLRHGPARRSSARTPTW